MTCTGPGFPGTGPGFPGTGPGSNVCTSNGAGSPCGLSSGPASQPASSTGQNLGAGNPINVLSGNKYQVEVDLPPLPGVLGLEIVRHYNSQYARPNVRSGSLGRGWRLSYETELYVVKNTVQIVQADGTRIIFSRDAAHPSVCATADPARGQVLVRPTARGEEFIWVWPDGRRLYFDTQRQLTQIVAPTGEFVSLTRDPTGALLKVMDPQGRSLVLTYGSKHDPGFAGVRFIDSPVGRFAYTYGSTPPAGADREAKEAGAVARTPSNLVRVTLPAQYAASEKAHPWANRGTTQSAVTRTYHYESARHPTLLTGISVTGTGSDGVPMQVRIASWDYDDQARAVLSVKGERPGTGSGAEAEAKAKEGTGQDAKEAIKEAKAAKKAPAGRSSGPEEVRLAFPQAGTTVLTNSLGQTTTYRWAQIAGEQRLLEALGPGCASCGPTNVRYGYDAQGRLAVTTQLDAQGTPRTAERLARDAAGRIVKKERFRFVKGQPVPAGWVRFEYAPVPAAEMSAASASADPDTLVLPDPKPVRVIRPSVVAGKTHAWRFTYNAAGQPRSVTETGFAPAVPEQGKRGEPTPITRTTTYAYTTINGRSLLASIDGPLPNGPKADPSDSDVTALTWDGRGDFVATVTAPGNFATTFSRDDAGRISIRTLNDGVRRIETRIAYAGQGNLALTPIRVERTGWPVVNGKAVEAGRVSLLTGEVQFNALGEATRQTDAAGRVIQRSYDASGRPASVADGQGHRQVIERDTEGRPWRIGLYRPDSGADPYRATYFWRDDRGQAVGQLLPDGRLLSWTYDATGEVTERIDGDDVRHVFLRQKANEVETAGVAIEQAPDGALRLSSPGAERRSAWIDDFGQVLRVALPDHGPRSAQYDAAGRIVRIDDAGGGYIAFTYDAAGRLTGKRFVGSDGATVSQTVVRHEGRCLAEVADAAQTSRYACDALGRRITESVRLAGLARPFETALRFDPASGLIMARTLADGRVLRFTRNTPERGAGVTAMLRQPAWAAAVQDWVADHVSAGLGETLGRILPSDTVVRDIAVDPFDGLTAYTTGNGLTTRKSFDLAGRLTGLDSAGVERRELRYGTGPRIRAIDTSSSEHSAAPVKAVFTYSGFGQLVWPDEKRVSSSDSSALAAPVRDALGRVMEDARFRYAYTPQGQLAEVQDKASRNVIARYRYNSTGQRVAKSVFDAEGKERVSFTLWQDGVRVAEIDEKGNITAQALYLAEGQRTTPVAQLDGDHVLAIHADQRGAPVAMTDADQKIVWRAHVGPWGAAMPAYGKSFGPASLNLRLPGQYYDEETGLHDNGFRTYDPSSGNYLQPDPLGYPDGPDAYRYAGGDPVNKIDPSGLYESDIHYYMTFFLAAAAGMNVNEAQVVALAAQYVDDSPDTKATAIGTTGHITRLLSYHFTPVTSSVDPATGLLLNGYSEYGNPPNDPAYANLPQNAQLIRLSDAISIAASEKNLANTRCTQLQFFGEYLHAFEDTFGHRDRHNLPYAINGGLGHADDGSKPDYTYDDAYAPGGAPWPQGWYVRAARTLQMEQEVFAKLTNWGNAANAHSFAEIEQTLKDFNAIKEHEGWGGGYDRDNPKDSQKIKLLNNKLKEWGIPADLLDTTMQGQAYKKAAGEKNRNANLCDKDKKALDQTKYPGTILPTCS